MNNEFFFTLYNFAHQSAFSDFIIIFCGRYLPYLAVLFVLIYIFYHHIGNFDWRNPFLIIKKRLKEFILIFSPAITGWIFASILKSIFARERPFIKFNELVTPLFTHGGMDSFPSGHATFYMALALSIFFKNKKLGLVYFSIALLIGLARIMVGVHFPIDILAGYILGVIIALIFKLIFKYKK